MALLCHTLNDASSSLSALASPLGRNLSRRGTDGVVGPAGVLVLLKWHFALVRVELWGKFDSSTGVVVVGDNTGISSDSGVSIL